MSRFVLLMILSGLCPSLFALGWGELQPEFNKIEANKKPDPKVMAHLVSTVDTAMIYTKSLQTQQLQPLFCVPAGNKMDLSNVLSVIKKQAEKQDANRNTPIGEIFIRGMGAKYPCNK